MATLSDVYYDPNPGRDRKFRERHPYDAYFFPGLVAVIWAIMLLGFVPEVLHRIGSDARPYPWIIHIHAVLFFGWLAFLASQVALVRTGHVR